MSQPPTAPQDPYQFDPYRPHGADPAQQAPSHDAWTPQGEAPTQPYGSANDAYAAPGYGAAPEQAPYGAGQAPYGAGQAPVYGTDQQQGYGQPYGDPAQQPYGSPYGNGYSAYTAPAPATSTIAIVGFVLAILGFLGSWIPFVNIFAALLGITGVVLGFVGLSQVKQGRSGKGFSITAIVLGVLSVLATILMWVVFVVAANEASTQYEQTLSEVQEDSDRAFGEATDDILANDLGVEFGTFEGTADELGWVESSLPVTFTNTSDEPLTFDIDVDAFAADGTVIESDWAYSETLEPGASETVEIFDFIDAENLEAMKTATFEVTQASAY
ncbi:hypothetical protein ACWFQT_02830 [Cellulosimicrobium cellulans]